MPKHEPFDHWRRGPLIAGGALAFATVPRSWRALAQATGGTKLRIGVIGSGHIGGTIGGLCVKAGYPVLFSSRHPDELSDLVARLGPLAHAGTLAQAIAFGDAVFVAVPYGALKGKIVIGAYNAVAARDGAIAEEVKRNGVGITSERYLAGTRLVRVFYTLPCKIFAHEANRPDPKLAVPIAGDDPGAVQAAAGLVRDAGFEPVVVGKLADARWFQCGGPGYDQAVTAADLKQKLSLTP